MIDMKFLGVLVFAFVLLIGLTVIITLLALGLFLGKALIRYIRSGKVRKEKAILKKSLGEVLKQHREQCRMTQEFVAEAVGVSRAGGFKMGEWNLRPKHFKLDRDCEAV